MERPKFKAWIEIRMFEGNHRSETDESLKFVLPDVCYLFGDEYSQEGQNQGWIDKERKIFLTSDDLGLTCDAEIRSENLLFEHVNIFFLLQTLSQNFSYRSLSLVRETFHDDKAAAGRSRV